MKMFFVVDDDVSQEELEKAVQQSFLPSTSCNTSNAKKPSGKRKLKDDSTTVISRKLSNSSLFKGSEIKTGVLKKISRKNTFESNINNDINNKWIVTPIERSHSDDLKERLKVKEGSDKFSSSEDTVNCVNGFRDLSSADDSAIYSDDSSSSSSSKKRKIVHTSELKSEIKKPTDKNGVSKEDSHYDFIKDKSLESLKSRNGETINIDQNFQNGSSTSPVKSGDGLPVHAIDADIFTSPQTTSSTAVQDDHYYSELSMSIPDHMYVALDCEMVGVGDKGRKSVLGRCSIVDYKGDVLYDKFVRPSEVITDFRTRWSGIRPSHMKNALPIDTALQEIKDCLKNKIVIGHAVYNDFKVIRVEPIHDMVRDTATCKLLSEWAGLSSRSNGLKKLTAALLDQNIQVGSQGHCSVEDARASLSLFKLCRSKWEPELLKTWAKRGKSVAASLREGIRSNQAKVGENYLEDQFWPSHVTG